MKTIIITLFLYISPHVHAGLDNLFYHPDAKLYRTSAQDGYAFEEVTFVSRDMTQLSGWFIPAKGEAH